MSEDMILAVKWLESDEGEEWSRSRHVRLYRPLLSVVSDGDPSCIMGHWRWIWVA